MVYTLLSFVMAIAPALYLVRFYYHQDQQKPEPTGLIVKVFLLGFCMIMPAMVIEYAFDRINLLLLDWSPLMYLGIKSFVVVALCEEVLKFLVVIFFVYRNLEFDEEMDGIVYTVMASMGFACMENIIYVMDSGLVIAIIRAFTAVPMHAFASGLMGFYLGKAKFADRRNLERAYWLLGLAIAVLIHGLYDLMLFIAPMTDQYSIILIFPILIASYYRLKHCVNTARYDDRQALRS